MRQIGLICANLFFVLMLNTGVVAQNSDYNPARMFRIYEDNDFINLRGKGTDEAYTNGIKIEYFYEKKTGAEFFLNKWMPKAGTGAVNTYGWGIMQMMYTPNNISRTEPEVNDFPYSGALFGIRSLHSDNAVKHTSFQTELFFGIIGPYSFAKEAQIAFHRLIGYQKPMGWDDQLKTDLLLNVNFTVEKQILNYRGWIGVTGGGKFMAGTMYNGISGYYTIRAGTMNPLFSGYIRHFKGLPAYFKNGKKRWQAYLMFKPQITYIQKNALISGGYFQRKTGGNSHETNGVSGPNQAVPVKIKYAFYYGFMVSFNKISLEITQQTESAEIRGAKHHEVGNISFFFSR